MPEIAGLLDVHCSLFLVLSLALDGLWTHAVALPHLLLPLMAAPGWSWALVCCLPCQGLLIDAVTASSSADHHDQTLWNSTRW